MTMMMTLLTFIASRSVCCVQAAAAAAVGYLSLCLRLHGSSLSAHVHTRGFVTIFIDVKTLQAEQQHRQHQRKHCIDIIQIIPLPPRSLSYTFVDDFFLPSSLLCSKGFAHPDDPVALFVAVGSYYSFI